MKNNKTHTHKTTTTKPRIKKQRLSWFVGKRALRQEKDIKEIQIGKEDIKISLFASHMILFIRYSKDSTRKLLELINTLNKLTGHISHIQKWKGWGRNWEKNSIQELLGDKVVHCKKTYSGHSMAFALVNPLKHKTYIRLVSSIYCGANLPFSIVLPLIFWLLQAADQLTSDSLDALFWHLWLYNSLIFCHRVECSCFL